MSTKAIREALALMVEIQGQSTVQTHAKAVAEVTAIERAAIVLWVEALHVRSGPVSAELAEAILVLQAIAKGVS